MLVYTNVLIYNIYYFKAHLEELVETSWLDCCYDFPCLLVVLSQLSLAGPSSRTRVRLRRRPVDSYPLRRRLRLPLPGRHRASRRLLRRVRRRVGSGPVAVSPRSDSPLSGSVDGPLHDALQPRRVHRLAVC